MAHDDGLELSGHFFDVLNFERSIAIARTLGGLGGAAGWRRRPESRLEVVNVDRMLLYTNGDVHS